jgi:poly-gamma-glutamate synthesis protein (capsule biosynthesis protein)
MGSQRSAVGHRRVVRWAVPLVVAPLAASCAVVAPEPEVQAEPLPIVAELHPVGEPTRPTVLGATAPAVTTTATAPTSTAPVRSETLSLAFTGDVLVHSPIVVRASANGGGAFDFAPMFAAIAPLVDAADLAICHLETPVAPPGEALSTSPRYGIPAEITAGLATAGFDRCSTASNHSLDRGTAGIDATIDALRAAGMTHAGTTHSGEEPMVDIIDVDGVAVAHLSYTFGFNGIRLPPEEQWRANLIDPARIVTDAAEARTRGADVVIVSLHAGVEGSATPNALQRDTVAAITSFGVVDLVIGHHAHVVQPIERVNGVWVAYGLGNFLSNMPTGRRWPAASQDGALLTVEVEVAPDDTVTVARPTVVPTWVDRETFEVRPVLGDLLDPGLPAERRAVLEASLARTSSVVGDFIG